MESDKPAAMTNQLVTLDLKKAKLTEMWKVTRSRKTNDELRGKRHLTPGEIQVICKTLRHRSRHKDRDECMVLVAFHHGLRVSELTNIKWQHIDLKAGQISIKRLKNGIDTVHPISDARELMLLKRLPQAQEKPKTGFAFRNERGGAVSANGFQKLFSAGRRTRPGREVERPCPQTCLRHRTGRQGPGSADRPGLHGASEYSEHDKIHARDGAAVRQD